MLQQKALNSSEGTSKGGGGVALRARKRSDYLELNNCDDAFGGLWVRIRGKANRADIVVGFCYRPHNQDEEADEILCKQLGEVSKALDLVLVKDLPDVLIYFDLPDVCWNTTAQEISGVCGRHSC